MQQDLAIDKRGATSIDLVIGQRIRARRITLGLSQSELGEKLDVSYQQIQKYEMGANRVSASRLSVIADNLAVPLNFFFEERSDQNDDLIARLFRAFSRVKHRREQLKLLKLVEDAAEHD